MVSINSFNFKNKHAIVRVDFNVPLNDKFEITDDTRIRESLPTIQKILKDGGSVVLLTHFGRPKKALHSVKMGAEEKYSTRHLLSHLTQVLNTEVQFADDCLSEEAYRKSKALQAGEVLLLENTRFYEEETAGDNEFAEMLSTMGDVYVNDAFGSAHRAHASTAIIAHFFSEGSKMFGMLMDREVANANKVMHSADKPFTAILGGAKISDKILLIESLLDRANNIIIGGGMAYTFFKATGGKIGSSLCEEAQLELAKSLIEKAKAKGVNFVLPIDSVIADKFDAEANTDSAENYDIKEGWMGLDIGPQAIEEFSKIIKTSKTILWNGPMGVFEMEKFSKGTKAIAEAVADATDKGAFSLIGGGDSVAAIHKFKLADRVSYASTGGGALLEFFEGKELPGIKAISQSN
ncbi:MAG: phosphoglycerate kinase [Chitinophagales bacterium]|nr:phosphoglycerate kinase [Chitinophagales bacterium]